MRRAFFTIVFSIVSICVDTCAYAADAEMEARISRLASLLRTDSSFKVRAYAARQLGLISGLGAKHDPRVIAALVDGLSDRDPVVRALAADSIGRHDAAELMQSLEKLARTDENDLVRQATSSAIARLRHVVVADQREAPRAKRLQRVELGRVQLDGGAPLQQAITDAIEELIEPHRPAMFPREDPDVRLELVITRAPSKLDAQGVGLAFEAHCVLVELPGARLRRASNATASAHTTKRGSSAIASLEKELALKAATRAVTEALAMLDE